MQKDLSTPDGVSTSDLALERDTVDLENIAENHLRESIANCQNISMIPSALSSIDNALEQLQARRKQLETKAHGLAFAAELFEVA